MRAHSILLSSRRITIKEIVKLYQVDRDTVASWIQKWEQHGVESLYDKPRCGRPSQVTLAEKELAYQYIKEDKFCMNYVVERLSPKRAKRLSLSALKRLAKKARLRWKRVRKSFKSRRDPEEFAQDQRDLAALQKQEDQGELDVYYLDESGFTLDPSMPYAWQEAGSVIAIPALKGSRINVLGWMHRKNDWHPYIFEQSINTSVVVACVNDFCKNIKKKTVVVRDNSSIHRSEALEECMARWRRKGLIIKYLIPYAPELNLIEILWRHIKYLWLPFSAYQCMEALREALERILKEFGSKYQITFV
jgi:transposase